MENSQNAGDDMSAICAVSERRKTAPARRSNAMVTSEASVITFFFLCLSTMVPKNMLDNVTSSM